LQVDSHFSPFVTAKRDSLTKLAAEFPIGALSQRGGTYPLKSQTRYLIKHERLRKIALKRCDGLRSLPAPLLRPLSQALAGLARVFGVIHRSSLLHQLFAQITVLFAFAFIAAFGSHMLQFVKNAPLLRKR
jgi:hypothetical protein